MGDEFVDILQHLIKLDDNDINFIFDQKGNVWFNARDILQSLEMKDPKKAIKQNIKKYNKIRIVTIDKLYKRIFPEMHPDTIFVNEFGMYDLILRSRMKKAEKFRELLTMEILPSIRKFGYYSVSTKTMQKLENENINMKEKMNFYEKRIETLENNQKKCELPQESVVYAIRPINDQDNIKIGRATKLKKRKQVIDNALPDRSKVIYYVKTKKPIKLERIIRSVLVDFIYLHGKDIFKISDDKIKIVFNKSYEHMKNIDKLKTGNHKIKRLHNIITLKEEIKKEFEKQGLSYYEFQTGGCFKYCDSDDSNESTVDYDINDPSIYLMSSEYDNSDEESSEDGLSDYDTVSVDEPETKEQVFDAFLLNKYKYIHRILLRKYWKTII
jgi:prophage antirepressor-like protein